MNSKLLAILFLGLFLINGIYASEFNINSAAKQSTGTPYRGDAVSYKGIIQADQKNICKIECQYSVSSDTGYVSDSGSSPSTELSSEDIQEFPFTLNAQGSSSPISTNLIITCDRIPNYINCWPETISQTKQINLQFLYPDDGICTTSKEKCANYQSFLKDDACDICDSLSKECRPDGSRNPDTKGCQNYCGNGICEKSEGENCSSCQDDCKKCDLSTCSIGSECEGNYCVWDVCWNSATRIKDGHCDANKGETCSNSPADCSCQTGERCDSTSNKCETYCGNGICEANEEGICKSDCDWCGDGSCDSSQKESCKNCESDCGVCESQKVNEEIQKKTKEVVEKGLSEVSEKQKKITYVGISAILLILFGYAIFKVINSKKGKKSKKQAKSKSKKQSPKKKSVKKKSTQKGKK